MSIPPRFRSTRLAGRWGVLAAAVVLLGPTSAGAQSSTSDIEKLNKQALDAYDSLSFDQAKTLLEQALAEAQAAALASSPIAARTHLNLGMVLIAGFQEARGPGRGAQRDEAIEHFRAALKIQPDLTPPAGLFNPEVQTVFDETKVKVEKEKAAEPAKPASKPARARAAGASKEAEGEGEGEGEGATEEEEATARAPGSPIFLSVGLGSGFGVAKGHLDANKDIMPVNSTAPDNSWSGGLAPSGLGHLTLAVGYFVSDSLLISAEGRLQIIAGTTSTPTTEHCAPSCTPPGTAFAGLAKVSWFLSSAPLRPFLSAGVGGGNIRQVVKVAGAMDCGKLAAGATAGTEQCVDTVTGGPLLLAAGGGIAYDLGSLALLGSLTANVGVPKLMLNVDALIGLGLRL